MAENPLTDIDPRARECRHVTELLRAVAGGLERLPKADALEALMFHRRRNRGARAPMGGVSAAAA